MPRRDEPNTCHGLHAPGRKRVKSRCPCYDADERVMLHGARTPFLMRIVADGISLFLHRLRIFPAVTSPRAIR